MLKRLAGLGCLALLLCIPVQADRKHHRSHRHEGHYAPGYVEFHVGTPYGYGVFVRGHRPAPYGYGYRYSRGDYYGRGRREYYGRGRREFREFKYKHRRYFKRHKHYHYDNYCPY